MTTAINVLPTVARWTSFFEKYVLSLLFLKIAFGKASALQHMVARGQLSDLTVGSPEFAATLLNVLTLLFGLFFGLSLLLNRKPLQEPQRWRDIVIPLTATFILYVFTALSPYMPELITRNLLPVSLQRSAVLLAIPVSIVGYAIALWSVAYLGRSLSLVVSVRELVARGPYRHVRHPMYLGYIVMVIGIAITAPSLFSAILLLTYLLLTVYRARLEEEALTAFSEEYRRYAARTGFLLPGLGRQEHGAGQGMP